MAQLRWLTGALAALLLLAPTAIAQGSPDPVPDPTQDPAPGEGADPGPGDGAGDPDPAPENVEGDTGLPYSWLVVGLLVLVALVALLAVVASRRDRDVVVRDERRYSPPPP